MGSCTAGHKPGLAARTKLEFLDFEARGYFIHKTKMLISLCGRAVDLCLFHLNKSRFSHDNAQMNIERRKTRSPTWRTQTGYCHKHVHQVSGLSSLLFLRFLNIFFESYPCNQSN